MEVKPKDLIPGNCYKAVPNKSFLHYFKKTPEVKIGLFIKHQNEYLNFYGPHFLSFQIKNDKTVRFFDDTDCNEFRPLVTVNGYDRINVYKKSILENRKNEEYWRNYNPGPQSTGANYDHLDSQTGNLGNHYFPEGNEESNKKERLEDERRAREFSIRRGQPYVPQREM